MATHSNRPTEKQVKAKIKTLIKLIAQYIPVYVLHPMTFGYGESGHPDTLLLVNGKLIGIEAKRDRNNPHTRPELKAKPSEVAQKMQAERIRAAGGDWLCVHNDNLIELYDLITKNYMDEETVNGMKSTHSKQLEALIGSAVWL